jgi:hypothetical protein
MQHKALNVRACLYVSTFELPKEQPIVAKRICAFGGHPSARIFNLPQSGAGCSSDTDKQQCSRAVGT